jgi:hypothetical protein
MAAVIDFACSEKVNSSNVDVSDLCRRLAVESLSRTTPNLTLGRRKSLAIVHNDINLWGSGQQVPQGEPKWENENDASILRLARHTKVQNFLLAPSTEVR